MSLEALLAELRRREIQLRVDGDRIRASAAPGNLTQEITDQIRALKPELLKMLAPQPIPLAQEEGQAHGRVRYPLSATQSRQAGAGRSAIALPVVLRLVGPLDVNAVRRSLELIVERHAPLRSRFFVNAERPYQEVLAEATVSITHTDLTQEEDPEAAALQFLAGEMGPALDLSTPPVGRFHLVRTAHNAHVFCAAFSPLVVDGWSQEVFLNEFYAAYEALCRQQQPELPKLEAAYADLIAWQDQRVMQRYVELDKFWSTRLGELLPPPPLPTDRRRPRKGTNHGQIVALEFGPGVAEQVRQVARANQSTPQMLLLAAFYVWLFRLSGQHDVVVATPAAARLHPSSEALIGTFVNVLLLRLAFDPALSFGQLIQRVRDYCLDAYDHQELPMDRLKVRSANYGDAAFAPAFQAEFSFQQVGPLKERMGDVQIQSLELPSGLAASELSLWVKDLGTDFSAAVEFKSELFELRTIVHWLACFQELLGNLLDNPELSIAMVPCVPEGGALEQSSLNALLVSGAPLPRWLSEEIGVTSWSEVTSVNLVEPTGSPVPLNCFGALRLQMPFRNLAAPSRVRLTHGGELQQELLSDPESVHAQFEAPQTDTEIQVAQLFGDLLGRTIGANDDYFEQGGNSLLAVRLFKEIHDRFGVSLPFTTILDAPTPRLLAAQVRAGVPKRQGSLVTLKTGPRREKLFLVHDGDGETLLYRNLARRMPPELGVIGLMPRSSGSLLIDTSISAIAAHFVREIRSAQPEGPYLVGGLCAGGLIAFEICRQLRQADRPVALLVLLDAAPPFAHARGASVERWNRFRSLTKGMSPSARVLTGTAVQASRKIWGFVEHATTSRTRQLSSLLRVELLRRWAAHSMPWPAWVTPPTFRELFDHMEHEYRGEALALPSLLVRATTGVGGDMASRELLIDPDFEWPKLITNEIQVADVPGGHSTMLREPNVDATAMVVVRAVERALAPYPYYEPGPSSAPASVRRRH